MPKKRKKSQNKPLVAYWSGNLNLGIICLVLGVYFPAKDLGWIPSNVPFWPLVLIILGVFLLLPRARN